MQENYLTAGFLDQSVNLWLFDYPILEVERSTNVRLITMLVSNDSTLIHPWFKILDHKNIVYLIVPNDALIDKPAVPRTKDVKILSPAKPPGLQYK